MITLQHPEGRVQIEQTARGKHALVVTLVNPQALMPTRTWETSYPVELIRQILDLKGPAYLCDEIRRDEDPRYVQPSLRYDLLSYVSAEEFVNKRLLDFGCGSGASTMILARMLPHTQIVGVELIAEFAQIARLRAQHYGYDRVTILQTPDSKQLPDAIGTFDYVVLSAVYEHLLPQERQRVLPHIWQHLKPGGVLFLDQTPYRYFPIETHTTGFPFINYLPDRLAFAIVHKFSKRVQPQESWEHLLRRGIRGGTTREILNILSTTGQIPRVLEPQYFGITDQIELWHTVSQNTHTSPLQPIFVLAIRLFKAMTEIVMLPYLSLAIKKQKDQV